MTRTLSPHLRHTSKPVEWGLCLSKGGAHRGTVNILAPGAPSINTFSFLNVHALGQSCALRLRPRWPLVLPVTLGKASVGFLQTQWSFLLKALPAYSCSTFCYQEPAQSSWSAKKAVKARRLQQVWRNTWHLPLFSWLQRPRLLRYSPSGASSILDLPRENSAHSGGGQVTCLPKNWWGI